MLASFRTQNVSNRALLLIALLLLAVRVAIAAGLPLFGDEAFYWQESRALDWSFSDVPPMTAALIAIGTSIGGDTLLGVRWPFLLIGTLLPLVLRQWALWRLGNEHDANLAALCAMCLPLIAIGGMLALPDVPLTLLMLLAFVLLDRAADRRRWRDWIALGLCLAVAWMTHWRAAALAMAGVVWLLLTPRGRQLLLQPGLWLTLLLSLSGLLPALWFNAGHDWSALRFQLLERNPWSFQVSGLWIGVEQLLVLTPPMAFVLLAALRRSWQRRAQAPEDLMFAAGFGIIGMYLLVGLFADNVRTRLHWPLAGYLPLLLAAPAVLQQWRQRAGGWRLLANTCVGVTMLGAGGLLVVLAAAASPRIDHQLWAARFIGTGFLGWPEVAAVTRQRLATAPPGTVLIADNFLLAAELDFALGGQQLIYVLDHPRNIRHGRQTQLAIWQRDQASLQGADWSRGLIVFEVPARPPGQSLAAWQSLCAQLGDVRWRDEVRLGNGDMGFLIGEVQRRPAARAPAACEVPAMAYLDFPTAGQRLGANDSLLVSGWAIADTVGIEAVTVMLDGRVVGLAAVHLLAPHVRRQWPISRDPDHPDVGFKFELPAASLAPGRHRIEIEVQTRAADAVIRRFGPVWIEIDAAPQLNGSIPISANSRDNAISGRPISAVGSALSMASNRLMPSPSHLKPPAQSQAGSRSR